MQDVPINALKTIMRDSSSFHDGSVHRQKSCEKRAEGTYAIRFSSYTNRFLLMCLRDTGSVDMNRIAFAHSRMEFHFRQTLNLLSPYVYIYIYISLSLSLSPIALSLDDSFLTCDLKRQSDIFKIDFASKTLF